MGDLTGKTILITGAARRIGRTLALTIAHAGADVLIHHAHSAADAESLRVEIEALGRKAWVLEADLEDPAAAGALVGRAAQLTPIHALVNNAAIFEPLNFMQTDLAVWDRHLAINLTAPFLLSQAFAAALPADAEGRIVNIVDWRALRPGRDHFAYTISKAGLAAMTQATALALAPRVLVNGLAFGAILAPSDGTGDTAIIKSVPARRWATMEEVGSALLFLLTAGYITGEIVHLDGGRHLV